jgi:hypothetical protein
MDGQTAKTLKHTKYNIHCTYIILSSSESRFYFTFQPNRLLNGQYTNKYLPTTFVLEKSPQTRES